MELQRKFITVSDDGLVIVNAALGKIFYQQQEPYFTMGSDTTAWDDIVDAFSGEPVHDDVRLLKSLHLRSADGVPMFALENAWYSIQNGDIERAAGILRCPVDQARASSKTQADLERLISTLKPTWQADAMTAKDILKKPDYTSEPVGRMLNDGPRRQPLYQDGGGTYPITTWQKRDDGGLWLYCGLEFIVFPDLETADEAAREQWKDMANYDPEEFEALAGTGRLARWESGKPDRFGVSSLDEYLDTIEEISEETFATYDARVRWGEISTKLTEAVGWKNEARDAWVEVVAFRAS